MAQTTQRGKEVQKMFDLFLKRVRITGDVSRYTKNAYRTETVDFKIFPLLVSTLRETIDDDIYVADALFLLVVGQKKKIVNGQVRVNARTGSIMVTVGPVAFEIDVEKLNAKDGED